MTAAPLSKPNARLLIVDDDRLVLATLAQELIAVGYCVTAAESTEEAESCLASGYKPDLAILDVRMPGQGGMALALRLRDLDHVPFMMLSAYGNANVVQQAVQLGALGYSVKPLDPQQLVPAIEAALARANELQELRDTRRQLQIALDNERDISLAVGIAMVQHNLPRRAAFELLRERARSRRCKLSALAAEVIQGREQAGSNSSDSGSTVGTQSEKLI